MLIFFLISISLWPSELSHRQHNSASLFSYLREKERDERDIAPELFRMETNIWGIEGTPGERGTIRGWIWGDSGEGHFVGMLLWLFGGFLAGRICLLFECLLSASAGLALLFRVGGPDSEACPPSGELLRSHVYTCSLDLEEVGEYCCWIEKLERSEAPSLVRGSILFNNCTTGNSHVLQCQQVVVVEPPVPAPPRMVFGWRHGVESAGRNKPSLLSSDIRTMQSRLQYANHSPGLIQTWNPLPSFS